MWMTNGDLRCDQVDCIGFLGSRDNRASTEAAARFLDWSMFDGKLQNGKHVVQHLCPRHRSPLTVPKKVARTPGQQELF